MTRRLLPALLLLSCATWPATAGAEETPLTALPYSPSLDVRSMDRGADPCVDFYQYSCGGWMKANPIPADQASWSFFRKLGQDNQRYLWGILDGYARNTGGRNATQQKIGDYFASCMDEAAVEKLGARPLRPHLARIDAMKSKAELPAVMGALHLAPTDSGLFFGFTSNQDFGDSSRVIAWAEPGGLGLPDRDYYVKDDARSKEIREKYLAHVAQVFGLLGQDGARARSSAERVLAFETALAQRSFTRVERRD